MTTYNFDVNARVECQIEAQTEDEAVDLFAHRLNVEGLTITPDSYAPVEADESVMDYAG